MVKIDEHFSNFSGSKNEYSNFQLELKIRIKNQN